MRWMECVRSVVSFGPFEFDGDSGVLLKSGTPIPLQEQSRVLLQLFVLKAGAVITREEIRFTLWPSDVHVDFEQGINVAVARLRNILSDSAAHPLYIERVPRAGYRFIAPLQKHDSPEPQPPPPPSVPAAAKAGPAHTDTRPWSRVLLIAIPCLLLSAFWIWRQAGPRLEAPEIVAIEQFTKDGAVKMPKLVSTGTQVFFGEDEAGVLSLFQASVSDGNTKAANQSFAGEWPDPLDASPNGSELLLRTNQGLMSWPVAGAAARPVDPLPCDFAKWSPDATKLACAVEGDLFVLQSSAHTHALLHHAHSIQGIVWQPDSLNLTFGEQPQRGSSVIVQTMDTTNKSIRKVEVQGVEDPIPALKQDAWNLYLSGHDHQIYAASGHASTKQLTHGPVEYYALVEDRQSKHLYGMGQIERGELHYFDRRDHAWHRFLNGLSADCLAWSAGAARIAYTTYPDAQLFISQPDGSGAKSITPAGQKTYHPAWSPDGKRLAYTVLTKGDVWRIMIADVAGGAPRELLPNARFSAEDPNWANEGSEITFVARYLEENPPPSSLFTASLSSPSQVKALPHSEGLMSPRWSPNKLELAALTAADHRVVLYNPTTQSSRAITGPGMGWPQWSNDGRTLCFFAGRSGQFACTFDEGQTVNTVASIPFSVTGNTFSRFWDHNSYATFTPEGNPLALRDYDQTELFVLKMRWPSQPN